MANLGVFHFVTPLGDGLLAKGKGPANVIKLITRALNRQGVQSEVLTSDELISRGPA
ncbi:MAG: hypothetical protein ACSHW1_04030 [Yoonia sp.]|uniref:hypothetical protein n=1 Tax=Yoonia sp. TaxID=2212373 RepID=UPI003EF858BB